MTADELIAFEREVAAIYDTAQIRAPVHLAGGNEQQLISVFRSIDVSQDWIACTWRSHYHCLLKGVPRAQLLADIRAGKSIALCYPEHRIISSAIVGGHLPIALGIAWAIKRKGGSERVHAFLGDMAARGGMFHEVRQYAAGHDLPMRFIVEDNGISVCTPTVETWGGGGFDTVDRDMEPIVFDPENLTLRYRYALAWPHAGAGKRVNF